MSNSLKAISLKQFCDRDTLRTWLLPPLAGVAITGTVYWYYKKTYAPQAANTTEKPQKHSARILIHPKLVHNPPEKEKEVLNEIDITEENPEILATPSENLLDVKYSEEDEEVYSILRGGVKKTLSLPDSQEMLCSTKHMSRGDLPEELSLAKYLGPSLSKDLSAGDKGSSKEKGASQNSKTSNVVKGTISKLHTPIAVHQNVEKAQNQELEEQQELKEPRKASGENVMERERDATNEVLSAAEKREGPRREHFRVISQGDSMTISKTAFPPRKTSFNFYY